MLLILDEAHRCDTEALNMLFEVVQVCMGAKLPLALILAGTPGLESHLRKCEVTYVERSKIMIINTLSREEARMALELPARKTRRPFEPDALEALLDWSDNYPFFIQMAGTHAWDASEARSAKDIAVDDAKEGLVMAEAERKGFFRRRRHELKQRHLIDYAVQVAGILGDSNGDMEDSEVEERLMRLNKGMDNDSAMDVVEQLQELGFLWHSGDGLEPGIPSMFDFLTQKDKLIRQNLGKEQG